MKKVYAKRIKPGDLENELSSLQRCGYTINNVFQDHFKEFGTNKEQEAYTIVYERGK